MDGTSIQLDVAHMFGGKPRLEARSSRSEDVCGLVLISPYAPVNSDGPNPHSTPHLHQLKGHFDPISAMTFPIGPTS